MNVVRFQDEICEISVRATGEAKLASQLDELKALWDQTSFNTKVYKENRPDVFILTGDGIEDMFTALDESMANIAMILGNRYVAAMRDKAEHWKKDLNTINSALEQWVKLQKTWQYLETILLSGAEIRRALGKEVAQFEKVDLFFRKLMQGTNKQGNAIKVIRANKSLVE